VGLCTNIAHIRLFWPLPFAKHVAIKAKRGLGWLPNGATHAARKTYALKQLAVADKTGAGKARENLINSSPKIYQLDTWKCAASSTTYFSSPPLCYTIYFFLASIAS